MLENHMVLGDYYDESTIPDDCAVICEGCGDRVHEDDMRRWAGERRCTACCFLCPVCRDVEVLDEGEFCVPCAMWALGVDI